MALHAAAPVRVPSVVGLKIHVEVLFHLLDRSRTRCTRPALRANLTSSPLNIARRPPAGRRRSGACGLSAWVRIAFVIGGATRFECGPFASQHPIQPRIRHLATPDRLPDDCRGPLIHNRRRSRCPVFDILPRHVLPPVSSLSRADSRVPLVQPADLLIELVDPLKQSPARLNDRPRKAEATVLEYTLQPPHLGSPPRSHNSELGQVTSQGIDDLSALTH